MDKEYYILSTKYSLQERQTKRGRIYNCIFRVIDKTTLEDKQKWLRGFHTKTATKQGYTEFVTEKRELIKEKPKPVSSISSTRQSFIVANLSRLYFAALHNQLKEATILLHYAFSALLYYKLKEDAWQVNAKTFCRRLHFYK